MCDIYKCTREMLVGRSTGETTGGNAISSESSDLIPASSSMISSKITSVVKQLSTLVSTGQRFDSRQFSLCVSLARGIDYAIANNEIPDGVHELPSLFKQVCKDQNGVLLQATSMMLMVSLKSACRSGWFLAKDADELLNCADELSEGFCNPADIVIEPNNPPPVISKILNRFCPCIKMTRIFASLELKPGFGAYFHDFHVSKNDATAREKIRLFVAQMDNVDTSSCLITPQQANFLLNGKGIRRRIVNSLDNGPQIPTNVTAMVKYGTNLLQAVGHFNGNYTIIIAFTSEVSSIDTPDLQHYAHPLSAVNSLDSEIVKGPSRISLNCPISFRRISVPVKGGLCKHHQCFDYANYIKINSRRPSWRCPQCNQSVCYTDIRIDQRTVEVLEDVGENVADVIISTDGSWKPVRETDDPAHEQAKTLRNKADESNQCVPQRFSESAANVVDLVVEGIDKNNAMDTREAEDINSLKNSVHVNEPKEFDITGIQNKDAFPLKYLFSNSSATSDTVTPNTRLNPCVMDPVLEPSSTSFTLIRMPNDVVIPTHNRDPGDVCGTSQSTNSLIRNYSIPDNLSLQSLGSSGFWDLVIKGETGRTPIQALPVQPLVPKSRQRARPSLIFSKPSSVEAGGATETPQQGISRSNMDANSASDMFPSPPAFPPMTQNWGSRQPPVQRIVGLPAPSRFSGSYQSDVRISSSQTSEDLQNLQPSPGTRVSQMASRPIMARPPPHLSHMQVPQGGSPSNAASQPGGQHSLMKSQQSAQGKRFLPVVPVQLQPRRGDSQPGGQHSLMKSRQPAQRKRFLPAVPVQLHPRRGSSSLMVGYTHRALIKKQRGNVDKLPKVTPDQNWRPSGRMRGSLSGRAHADALNQYIIQPTQVTSPPSIRDAPLNPFSTPSGSGGSSRTPSHIANNSDKHAPTSGNQPMQVDAELCVDAEVGISETKQEKKYGVRGLKLQNHPTLVQAEKEREDEAGLCRRIGDDDKAERKKKKKKKKTVAREELGLSCQSGLSTEGLNKTYANVNQAILTANRDGSFTSMENMNLNPKEMQVENNPSKRTSSVIFESKKLNAKNDVKEKHQSVKIVQESFVCRACGQEGHMRTNKNCPRYGEYLDAQIKLTNNSNMHAPTLVDQPMQVDAEECGKAEVGSNESKKGKTDGARELKMLRWAAGLCRMRLDGKHGKHPTQVQADEEIEDEAAKTAGLCRMLMDDDEAERKKKKETVTMGRVESGLSWQSGLSAEEHKKTNGNIKQVIPTAQPDALFTSMENISRDPKEVESVLGERTFSGNFKTKSDVKVKHSAAKNARERFICGACGQEGHMRTSKNCPRYGKDADIQVVESSGTERVSWKRNRGDSTAQPKRNSSITNRRFMQECDPEKEKEDEDPEFDPVKEKEDEAHRIKKDKERVAQEERIAREDDLRKSDKEDILRVEQAAKAAHEKSEMALWKRQRARTLMEYADLMSERATMALKIAKATRLSGSSEGAASSYLDD